MSNYNFNPDHCKERRAILQKQIDILNHRWERLEYVVWTILGLTFANLIVQTFS